MNLTIHTPHVALAGDLHSAVDALVSEGLQAMGAPPDTAVEVTLRGPAGAGSHPHRATLVVHTGGGAVRASGRGPDAASAVASLREALLHQAHAWRTWHEGGPHASSQAPMLHGRRISEQAMREADRLGAASTRYIATPRRPQDYR